MVKINKQVKLTFLYLLIGLAIFIFGHFPEMVETYYSQTVYPLISVVQRIISSIFPFAIGDFLYALIIALALWELLNFSSEIKKIKQVYLGFGLKVINFVLLIYISFKLLWGLNYARPAIHTQLEISNAPYQKEDLLKLSVHLLKKLNTLDKSLHPSKHQYTLTELTDRSTVSYQELARNQPFFKYNHESVKRVNSAWFISKFGIEGYYNPLSGEANINTSLPTFVLPFVVCHEIAHQIGVAKEDEANLVGYLAAVNSVDKRFQYSAYYNMFRYVLFEIRMKYPKDYNTLIEKVPTSIKNKFKIEQEFWATYNGSMSVYMSHTFDKILKLNDQEKGIDSYQDIVLWLYNYHKTELK